MREIHEHEVNVTNQSLRIIVGEEASLGGAPHHYHILYGEKQICSLVFQHGLINEEGVNGVTNEVLLAIVADRLRHFQDGPYRCRHNALALTDIESAQNWLQRRTRERLARGVEGTHTI